LQHFYDDLAFARGDSAATAAVAPAHVVAAAVDLLYIAIKSCDISAIFQAARACVQVSKSVLTALTRYELQGTPETPTQKIPSEKPQPTIPIRNPQYPQSPFAGKVSKQFVQAAVNLCGRYFAESGIRNRNAPEN